MRADNQKAHDIFWFLVIIVALATLCLFCLFRFIEFPRSIEILECKIPVSNATFKVPNGRKFYLLYASSTKANYAGLVTITDKNGITNQFLINSSLHTECNWLKNVGYETAFIITGFKNTNAQHFSEFIKPGEMYNLQIQFFNGMPQGSNSIWLYYVQARKDIN